VLLVEDDRTIAQPLRAGLSRECFEVEVATTGYEALVADPADLVLLDLGLPDVDGRAVCKELRSRGDTPIIVVSARSEEVERVALLEMGADDYLVKPFGFQELVARMRAVLRRHRDSDEPEPSVLSVGPVRMDVDRHVVTVRGQTVQLPLKEFELLEVLLRNAGRVLTRGQLIDRVWGADYVGDTKTLDVHIKRLRAKIELDPARPRCILTVRGLGYKFDPADEE